MRLDLDAYSSFLIHIEVDHIPFPYFSVVLYSVRTIQPKRWVPTCHVCYELHPSCFFGLLKE
jgi:hypothetical protein